MGARNAVFEIYRAGRMVVLGLALGISSLNAQPLATIDSTKEASVDLLNGKLKVVFKNMVLTASKPDQFSSLFFKTGDTVKILCAEGFRMNEDATLEFYQTAIDKPMRNDGVLAWKSIALFTDQISQRRSIESGWKMVNNDYLYFVKMVSEQKPQRYFEFTFFYIDNKLSFSVMQCPRQFSQKYKRLAEENFLSFLSN